MKTSKKLFKIAKLICSYKMSINNQQKQELNNYINSIKQNKDVSSLGDFFYTLLTKGGLTKQELASSFNSYGKNERDAYNKFIEKLFPLNNGAWSQINFNKDKSSKKQGKTYNFYVSIEFKDKQAINNYLRSLHPLMIMVKQLSDKHNKYIGFKTHSKLTSLLNHNDTLKVYYYDNDNQLKNQIQKLVKDYVSKFNLKRGTRIYDHGLDSEGTSFGDRIGKQMAKVFIKWVNDNKNKYDNDKLIKSFEKYLDDWIHSISQKLK